MRGSQGAVPQAAVITRESDAGTIPPRLRLIVRPAAVRYPEFVSPESSVDPGFSPMDISPVPSPTVVVKRAVRPAAPYVPAIGPRLRVLLVFVFGLFAILGATGVYLSAVTLLNYARSPQSYTAPFGLWVFLSHTV